MCQSNLENSCEICLLEIGGGKMANAQVVKEKILNHFKKHGWEIRDVSTALGVSEQYLRKILNNPEKHIKQLTDIISYYKIR